MFLITGGRGFVGRNLINSLATSGFELSSLVRASSSAIGSHEIQLCETSSTQTLLKSVQNVSENFDAVIHCAGLAHGKIKNASYKDYERANVELTDQIAEVALKLNVKKFIFLSTVGVHGRSTESKVTESSTFAPYDFYTRSKLEAENLLIEKFKKAGLESRLVIIRPPLIVGPRPPGSFEKLIRLSSLPAPLPFGAVHNKRTILSLDNLIDFVKFALENEKVHGSFSLADDEILSTREIIAAIRSSLAKRPLLVPVPASIFKLMATLVRRPHIYEQLFGNLVVSNSRAKSTGWTPTVSSYESIAVAAKSFNGN